MGAKQKIKLAKSFADAVEEGVFALNKKPNIVLTKKPSNVALERAIKKKVVQDTPNLPDVGATKMAEYSPFERGVQTIENVDSAVGNVGFLAEYVPKVISKFTQLSPNAALTGRVLSGVGKLAEPVQPALWVLDAARTLADPKYRAEAQKALESEMDDTAPNKKYSPSTFFSAVSRPNSTAQAIIDTVSSTETRDMNSELKAQRLDRRLQDLIGKNKAERATILGRRNRPQREQDVPAVDVNQQRDQEAARKFFK
jgi:hypothetical protein